LCEDLFAQTRTQKLRAGSVDTGIRVAGLERPAWNHHDTELIEQIPNPQPVAPNVAHTFGIWLAYGTRDT
jgi:hypothetical protein